MRPVEHEIWLIESRLGENPHLDDIARETGLSRYYICRVFAEETGTTLAAYVRSRRLSEAAKALLAGAPHILDIALAAMARTRPSPARSAPSSAARPNR